MFSLLQPTFMKKYKLDEMSSEELESVINDATALLKRRKETMQRIKALQTLGRKDIHPVCKVSLQPQQ